jgi:hypothetical protein
MNAILFDCIMSEVNYFGRIVCKIIERVINKSNTAISNSYRSVGLLSASEHSL